MYAIVRLREVRAMAGDDRLERRISAVLAMDVFGYTRLMGADESGTFVRWQQKLRELIQPQVAAAHGRVFKTMGDGLPQSLWRCRG